MESLAPSTHRFIASLFSALPDLGPAPLRLRKLRRIPGARDGGRLCSPEEVSPHRADLPGGGSALCQQIIVPAVAPVIHQPAARFQSAGPLSLRNYRSTRQSRREIIVCSLLSPGKFKEKMRFRLLALDHGVFFPAVLIFKIPHSSHSAAKQAQGATGGVTTSAPGSGGSARRQAGRRHGSALLRERL